jgi:predicted ArsR family transcriptional regulator
MAAGDESRERILAELRSEQAGLDAAELGRRLGLHPNSVRWHLGALARAGLVSSTPAASGSRGRPRMLYRWEAGAEPAAAGEYRLLATILSGTLAERRDGVGAAEEAGRRWGRYLVERPSPLAHAADADAVAGVAALLRDQGFAPEVAEGEIRMHRCPYHDLAEAQPEVVCAVHRGLIGGALEELGSELTVEALDVFVRPDLCVARLSSPPTRASRTAGRRSA